MRKGRSGIYFGRDGDLGYSLCMLHRTQRNSNYRGPYLLAIWKLSGVGDRIEDPWFTGYEWNERWITLVKSGVRIRCLSEGFAVSLPSDASLVEGYRSLCSLRHSGPAFAHSSSRPRRVPSGLDRSHPVWRSPIEGSRRSRMLAHAGFPTNGPITAPARYPGTLHCSTRIRT